MSNATQPTPNDIHYSGTTEGLFTIRPNEPNELNVDALNAVLARIAEGKS